MEEPKNIGDLDAMILSNDQQYEIPCFSEDQDTPSKDRRMSLDPDRKRKASLLDLKENDQV